MHLQKEILFTLFAEHGYVVSRQRRIIIEALYKAGQIDSIEDFWIIIRQQHGISWATVHNTMRILEKLGYVMRIRKNQQSYYKLCLPVICQNTDRI